MLTAKGRDTDIAKGMALGANAYMTKPFATRDLVEGCQLLEGLPHEKDRPACGAGHCGQCVGVAGVGRMTVALMASTLSAGPGPR